MARLYRYKVVGRGDFPWDMLRYDRVYPLSEPSPSRYDVDERWREPRTVEVQGEACTPARWSSFLWSVVDPNRDGFSHGLGCIEHPRRMVD
jgi:hypothetical protein